MLTNDQILDFEERYIPEPNSGCWLWLGYVNYDGYAYFSVNGKKRRAHRVSYILHKGNIPNELQIDHLCKVRSCVNPNHLEAVTAKVNTMRGDAGRHGKQNAYATHCRNGHPYSEDNTFFWKYNGTRGCKACYRKRMERQ